MAIFEPDGKNAIHDGIEHEPGRGKGLLDPTDTILCQRGAVRNSPHVEPSRSRRARQVVYMVAPNYGAVMESYHKAQDVITNTLDTATDTAHRDR